MKKFFVFIIFITIGCSVQVRTAYDHRNNFKKYRNFCWLKSCEFTFSGPSYLNDTLVRGNMQRAIKAEMKVKGLDFNPHTPDLLMDVHVTLETDTAFIYHGTGDEPLFFPTFSEPERVLSLKGTLVIDLVDQKTAKMVWRSVAVSYFDIHPDLTEKNIRKGVSAALKGFPPKLTAVASNVQ